MTKKSTIFLITGLLILAAIFLIRSSMKNNFEAGSVVVPDVVPGTSIKFQNPKKSAHYEYNTPAHGSILAAPPLNAVIDFNFDLAPPSSVSIIHSDGKEYGSGDIAIDSNKLAMRRMMAKEAPDGIYTVNYTACWPDKSCHKGYFQFVIDRSLVEDYVDLRNKPEVEIKLREIVFKPVKIRVSAGAKVTWVNDEDIVHYVNTDAHPSHTYYPAQNSKALAKGEAFSIVFDKAGAYPYHCSAHADVMKGSLIVE